MPCMGCVTVSATKWLFSYLETTSLVCHISLHRSALSIFQEAGLPLQVTKVMKMLLRNVREHSMETLFTHATRGKSAQMVQVN